MAQENIGAVKQIMTLAEFIKGVGVPSAIVLALMVMGGYFGQIQLAHNIQVENKTLEHRLATERARLAIDRAQQEMLSYTLKEFLKIHKDQAESVEGINNQIRNGVDIRGR